jgi:hypothetical protein
MDRRTFLGAALVLVPGAVAAAPVRKQPVVLWSEFNASISPGYSALRQVHLVVYADGTAIADTAATSSLGRSTAAALARTVAGLIRKHPHPNGPVGGATTELESWLGAHHFSGPVAAPPGTLAAHRAWIDAHGTPYAPDAVRLIVVKDPNTTGVPRPWPQTVPVPVLRRGTTWTQTDLTGAAAAAVARGMTHDDPADWHTYRMPDGSHLTATWRRLLPHELHAVPGSHGAVP